MKYRMKLALGAAITAAGTIAALTLHDRTCRAPVNIIGDPKDVQAVFVHIGNRNISAGVDREGLLRLLRGSKWRTVRARGRPPADAAITVDLIYKSKPLRLYIGSTRVWYGCGMRELEEIGGTEIFIEKLKSLVLKP
jgi:hypothetical protein